MDCKGKIFKYLLCIFLVSGPSILPKEEMNAYIHEFLLSQLGEEPEMASALMIDPNPQQEQRESESMC